jgi:hypothetical protein
MKIAAQSLFLVDSFFVLVQLQIQHYVDSMRLLNAAEEIMDQSSSATSDEGCDCETDDEDSVATHIVDEWIEEQSQAAPQEEFKKDWQKKKNGNAMVVHRTHQQKPPRHNQQQPTKRRHQELSLRVVSGT